MNQILRSFDRPLRSALVLAVMAGALLAVAPAAAQPAFSKAFAPDTIGVGSTSALTFSITASGEVTELEFTDVLPAGLVLASPPSPTLGAACDPATVVSAPDGGDTVTFTSPRLGAGATCTLRVDVTGDTAGVYNNTSDDLTSSGGNSGAAEDTLTLAGDRPSFRKEFSPDSVVPGAIVRLTFFFDYTGPVNVSNLSFTDNLPSGLQVATAPDATNTCPAGSFSASPGATSVSFFSGFMTPESSCELGVDVLVTGAGIFNNRTTNATSSVGDAGFAVDQVTAALDPVGLTKSFDDPVPPGGTTDLVFTLTNSTRDTVTGIGFTDDLDATLSGLQATGPVPLVPCGSGSSISGSSLLTFSGGTLASGDSCTFSVEVTVPPDAALGTYLNTTSSVDSSAGTFSPATDDLDVGFAPVLVKEFCESGAVTSDPCVAVNQVEGGELITARFTVSNPDPVNAVSGLTFDDDFAAFLGGATVSPSFQSGVCGGGSQFGDTGFMTHNYRLTGGSLAAGASCTFQVDLQLPADIPPGTYVNETTPILGDFGDGQVAGNRGVDEISRSVAPEPRLTKQFDDPVAPGATVTLRFTLTSAEGAAGTATDIAFTDDLSTVLTGLAAIDTPIADVCGTGSEISGTTFLSFTGGSLAPNSSCTFSVTLQVPAGAVPGSYPNTTSTVTATVDGVAVEGPAASDDLDVAGLGAAKQFTDDPAVAGGTVTLEFVLRNDDPAETVTDIAFTDDLDAVVSGLAYNGPTLVDPCGLGSQLTGTTLLSFTGGSLAPDTSCTFFVVLDVPAGAAAGEFGNATSQVTAMSGGSAIAVAPAADDLSVVDPLTIAKEFTDDPTVAGGTVTLQLTLANAHPTEDATSVAFTDDLDAALSGLQAVDTPIAACGGTLTGTSVLTFTGGTVPAADSCIVTVTVQVPAAVPSGTAATNTTSSVSGTIDGVGVTGAPASDDLLIEVAGLSKSFDGPTTATGTAVLTFTIENFGTDSLTDLAFTDDLDATLAGLTAVGLPMNGVCGAGSTISGTSFLTFTGGSLGAEASCTFDVTVEVPAGAAPGSHTNTTSDLSSSGIALALAATDDLVIEPPPGFSKSFSPATVGEGVPSTLTFTIDNTASALAATGLDFTDDLPAGVVVAATPNASTTCSGGTLTAVAGSGTVSYTGGTVAAGASCTVSVDVTAAAAGSYVNTSGALTSSSGSSGTTSSTLTVRTAPLVSKAFSPGEIDPGGTTTVVITIDNTAGAVQATGLSFTDTLPAGMTVADPANASTTCTGGTLTAVPGAGTFGYADGSVAAGASCAVMVEVTADLSGPAENEVVVLSSLGESPAAVAVLQVTGSIVAIPTAGTWGLLMLGALLAAGALWRLRM